MSSVDAAKVRSSGGETGSLASDASAEPNKELRSSFAVEEGGKQEHTNEVSDSLLPGQHDPTKEKQIDDGISNETGYGLDHGEKKSVSPEIVEYGTSPEEDMKNGKLRNGTGSFSSTDEERAKRVPQKYLLLSKRTFRNRNSSISVESVKRAGEEDGMKNMAAAEAPLVSRGKVSIGNGKEAGGQEASFTSEDYLSVQNWMEPEKEVSFVSPSKDAEFMNSNKDDDDHAKILGKVDELKTELQGFFNKTAEDKGSPPLGTQVEHFEGKVPPKQYRSSLLPFPNQPMSAPCSRCPSERSPCCHNEHCRPCPHNVCCHQSEPTASREPRPQNPKATAAALRLCRPVAGGAPFVICYRCYKLLQLPADFLLSAKWIHMLRCGACSQTLKYSFRPRTKSPPRTPAEARHPPSEEDVESNGFFDGGGRGGDPISFSEEYGMSFTKSHSYEAETSLRLAKNRVGTVEEEEQGGDRWRLHRLMGYPSAREFLFDRIKGDGGHRTEQARYV